MRLALGVAVVILLLAGCSDDAVPASAPEPSSSISTLTPIALPPPPPPTGRLIADMRQSSRDAAAGRMQVWVNNDTAEEVTPTRITYSDPRFRATLPATKLRAIPSQAERGFQIELPTRPACDHPTGSGTITFTYGDTTKRVRVQDPTDVAGRYTTARCLELALARVAALSWDDDVPASGEEDDPGTLTLVIEPTGRPGPVLTIDTIGGTPVLAPVGTDVWRPEVTVRGTDEPSRIDLPLKPNRCDDHAFMESGGATAFAINLTLDGRPGTIVLRMSTPGAANALRFAKDYCGDLSTVSGGG